MANEEVLGPRKTMFVLVIVVGCFAVLWPRILSPLILGHTREQLKPNQFDREAGCCEMIFESEVAVLELLNAVCSSIVHVDGKLSPYAAAECRKTVNETCGVDIAAFLKRDQNVGKATKSLLDMMKSSNSSCLKEHFGVPQWSASSHTALNSWTFQDTVKQERPPHRAGTHPAMRERGRAIAPGAPAPAPTRASPITMPPHVRVRSSPLDGYFDIDVKPPPIPGMRPPLGSPGGPVPAPKTSMGFVMPIYTICIIVFFVYTLSKILFKRTGSTTYESISPDPQFRRRVFRDDSRATPDKLGDEELEALRARLAETERAMQRIVGQLARRDADQQDNHARPYTNGTVLHNTGPVHIVASEYREQSKEKTPEPVKVSTPEPKDSAPEPKEPISEPKESTPEPEESSPEPKESTPESEESSPEGIDSTPDLEEELKTDEEINEQNESSPGKQSKTADINHKDVNMDLIKLTEDVESVKDESLAKATKEFLDNVKSDAESPEPKQSTPELLEEALKEESNDEDEDLEDENDEEDEDKGTVKVVGMEMTAHTADGGAWRGAPPPPAAAPAPARPHEAEEVTSIFLEGDIPQQSRVLVAEFADRADDKPSAKHSPMVVSGKMTLSLIQDAPRATPDRDPESTVDEFTTASAATLPAEKDDDLSDEEIEEIEVEEIEEEVDEEVEEEEEEEDTKPQPRKPAQAAREK